MKRFAPALMLVAVALASCAKAAPAESGDTGIRGEVVIGPTCPVETLNSPCPPAPFPAKITVSRGGDIVAEFSTPPDGRFLIPLPPGTYTVEAKPLDENGIARMLPLPPVSVRSSGFTGVTISFDSGIR